MIADAALVEQFLAARAASQAHTPPSAQGRALGLEEAYDLQDRLRAALLARGERLAGWKAGFTTRAAQEAYRVSEPACAFLLASGTLPSGAAVPVARFVRLAVEAEIAFVMRRDLAGPGIAAVHAGAAVEGALPALELIEVRYEGAPTGSDIVAEGVFARAIVLGGALTSLRGLDLALEGLVLEHNGAVAATATAAEVMGNPLNSLAWIANHLGRRGLGLRAGEIVMTGSVGKVLEPVAGDTVRATYTRLGSVSARFL